MTCEQRQVRQFEPIELGRHVSSGGTSGAQTAIVYVTPGSPLLRVALELYFRPTNQGGAVPSSGCTWSLAPGVRDVRGDVLALQTLFSGRTLPDGWELQTSADVLIATASIQTPSAESGAWFARVTGKLAATQIDPQHADEIMSSLVAERATPLLFLA